MHRVDTATAVTEIPAVEPAGTPGYFTKGSPAAGQQATVPGADFFNMIQEELVGILTAAGMTPDQDKDDFGQLAVAVKRYVDTTSAVTYRLSIENGVLTRTEV